MADFLSFWGIGSAKAHFDRSQLCCSFKALLIKGAPPLIDGAKPDQRRPGARRRRLLVDGRLNGRPQTLSTAFQFNNCYGPIRQKDQITSRSTTCQQRPAWRFGDSNKLWSPRGPELMPFMQFACCQSSCSVVRAHGLLSYYRTTELSELTECGQSSCSVHAVDMLLSMTEIASDAVAAAKGSLNADRPAIALKLLKGILPGRDFREDLLDLLRSVWDGYGPFRALQTSPLNTATSVSL